MNKFQAFFLNVFDSVSCSFLEEARNVFNVGPDIKQWVKTLYNLASSCILVNGQYSQCFRIQRVVSQRDPLSPYLYLIGADILSLMIRQNNNINGIRLRLEKKMCYYHSLQMTLPYV